MTLGVPPVTFARMRRRHLSAVSALDATRPDSSWNRRTFADELAGRNRHYVVALVGDVVVGYAGLLVQAGEGHVTTLMIDPQHRRSGLAIDLMNELVAAARFAECPAMTLEVREDNTAAIALYRSFGFAEEGARPSYYPDGAAATIMWRRDMAAGTPESDRAANHRDSTAHDCVGGTDQEDPRWAM